MSLAVVRGGSVVLAKGYGLADKRAGTPVRPETRFQIGSVSKSLTAWAVMTLAAGGRVELDAPVDRYLRRWHLPKSDFDNGKVTVRRVLDHTAGLSVRGYHGVFRPGETLPTLEESLSGYSGSDGGLRVTQEPGAAFEYSSGGYTLLQLLIEDISAEPFAAYMRSTIFEPLGMTNSTYRWTPKLAATVATPYSASGTPYPHFQFVEQGSGGLYTTGADLARFVAAAMPEKGGLAAGRGLLKPATVHQMLSPSGGTDGRFGLGYKMFPVSKDVRLVTHDGANEGWRAMFLMEPQKGDGIVVLTNSDVGGKIVAPIVCAWSERTTIDMAPLCKSVQR